jgi:hypothetical protein
MTAFPKLHPLVVAAGLALLLPGCDRPPASGTVAQAPPAAPVAADERVGVPECDDYLARYQACLESRAPASSREPLRVALEQSRATWRKAAAASADHRALAQVCERTQQAARTAMQAYGCKDF